MGAPTRRIELSDEETATLKLWAASGTTQQRTALRARVVLYASQGLSLQETSKRTGLSVNNCLKCASALLASDLKPHKVSHWCGKSPDPEFATK